MKRENYQLSSETIKAMQELDATLASITRRLKQEGVTLGEYPLDHQPNQYECTNQHQ